VLALFGRHLPPRAPGWIGSGSVGLSAAAALAIAVRYLDAPPGTVVRETLWRWIDVAGFTPSLGLYLDPLALVMVLVITGVGFLIHCYSTEYMAGDEGYARFFAYMNLFVAAMCTLVLADNLLALYLGWEGVGLCSYLLIGFWYRDPANGAAARKAFVVTRAGDTAFTLGLLLLFAQLGTLDIQLLMARALEQWPHGSGFATAAACLLLGGALGKSAQVPLQTWLPDAMAGPTPVSALIHAATMVTAGVYLIARTHVLFALAPAALGAVAVLGAFTLLVGGTAALVQNDIKRVLAYSTVSQIGYMFLALGVGAWTAALFHFMTHAFFKALLFLAAGAVIHALREEHDIHRMGGLRRRMPLAFWTFLIGACSLSALPLATAGFYSKDLILEQAWTHGAPVLWLAGWVGAVLTGLYIFRVVIVAFFGEVRSEPAHAPGLAMAVPLIVLAVLSVIGGCVETPAGLGDIHVLSAFLRPVWRTGEPAPADEPLGILAWLAVAASLGGSAAAYVVFYKGRAWLDALARRPRARALRAFWQADWGFDALYDRLFVRPYYWAARANRRDFIDAFWEGLAAACRALYRALSSTQDGRLRRYADALAIGAVLIVAIVLLL
jgi:NADH-quinone oxidoreductase subunit L